MWLGYKIIFRKNTMRPLLVGCYFRISADLKGR